MTSEPKTPIDLRQSWGKLKSIGLSEKGTKTLWQKALEAAGATSKDQINHNNFPLLEKFIQAKLTENQKHWDKNGEAK